MISAYCPAHITCFFQPVKGKDVLSTGSRGVGLRLDQGCSVSMAENRSRRVSVFMDGFPSEAPVTRKVADIMAPGRGFEITVKNNLPVGQGFGMSAAGAIATALCICEITGRDKAYAFEAAHAAEVMMKGGLGDVSALTCPSGQPVRITAGLPPVGEVAGIDTGLRDIAVTVLGPKLVTASVIGDETKSARISEFGKDCIDSYIRSPSTDALFRISSEFAEKTGVEGADVKNARRKLSDAGIRASMCMLGNSIFTDAPAEEIEKILGTCAFQVHTTSEPARITRKA